MAVRVAVFAKVGEGLRREILSALLSDPLAEAIRQAERIGFTSHEVTAAIGAAQTKAAFSHWERKA